jgi:hypothetical protein
MVKRQSPLRQQSLSPVVGRYDVAGFPLPIRSFPERAGSPARRGNLADLGSFGGRVGAGWLGHLAGQALAAGISRRLRCRAERASEPLRKNGRGRSASTRRMGAHQSYFNPAARPSVHALKPADGFFPSRRVNGCICSLPAGKVLARCRE